jgi:four helix bundle protein
MSEPSPARKRTIALHNRAIEFSTNVNRSYPRDLMDFPSEVVWKQLVRAADSASNNLIEAGNGSTDADFLNKMRLALREAKEAHACLIKILRAPLSNAERVRDLKLDDEADQLCAIFSTIITNMSIRLAEEQQRTRRQSRRRLRTEGLN